MITRKIDTGCTCRFAVPRTVEEVAPHVGREANVDMSQFEATDYQYMRLEADHRGEVESMLKRRLREWPFCFVGGQVRVEWFIQNNYATAYFICNRATWQQQL